MKLWWGILVGAALAACTDAPQTATQSDDIYGPCNVRASRPAVCEAYNEGYCDPATSVDLGPIEWTCQQYVPCPDGLIMYAYATPDCRYCIPANVCDGHGGGSTPIE